MGTRLERYLVGLEVLLAVGALAGAVGLATGGIDLGDATADLPFESPVLAGIALGMVNGLFPAAVVAASLQRHPWAVIGHLAVGAALVVWIVVQVAFIGLGSWLQPFYAAYGVAIFVLGAALRRHRPARTATASAGQPGTHEPADRP